MLRAKFPLKNIYFRFRGKSPFDLLIESSHSNIGRWHPFFMNTWTKDTQSPKHFQKLTHLLTCTNLTDWSDMFLFNCQTKRAIVALFIYPEISPCRVQFFGPGDWIFVCLHNCAIPHNRRFLPHNLPRKTHTIFFFFPSGLIRITAET